MPETANGVDSRQQGGMISLYGKLHSIMARVNRIRKDKKNQQGGYEYASEQAIKETLHPLFVEHKLLFIPAAQELIEITPPREGNKMAMTTIRCTYRVVDAETAAEVTLQIVSSGSDSTDKGAFKANTGALKYALTTLFIIPTGDDPEDDGGSGAAKSQPQARTRTAAKQDPEGVINDAQLKRLFALVAKVGKTKEQASEIIHRLGYGSSKEIKVKDYPFICAEIDPTTKEDNA